MKDVWQPIPPSAQYVALGMVVTTSENEPAIEREREDGQAVRCVSRALVVPSRFRPVKVWDNQGAAQGAKGSLWVINSLRVH